MRDRLPDNVDPWPLAESGAELEGRMPLAHLRRLGSLVHALTGEAAMTLQFGKDAQGRHRLGGTVSAPVGLCCQRCLEPYTEVLTAELRLALVRSESEAMALPTDDEPLVVQDSLLLADLVEDELILSLPLVPRHPLGQCPTPPNHGDTGEVERQRPFAGLAGLLDRPKQ